MSNEDRYHTTSWDGGQVRRQAAGEPSQPSRPSGGSGKKKAKKKRTNPFLALLLWVVVVIASSVILAGVGWTTMPTCGSTLACSCPAHGAW